MAANEAADVLGDKRWWKVVREKSHRGSFSRWRRTAGAGATARRFLPSSWISIRSHNKKVCVYNMEGTAWCVSLYTIEQIILKKWPTSAIYCQTALASTARHTECKSRQEWRCERKKLERTRASGIENLSCRKKKSLSDSWLSFLVIFSFYSVMDFINCYCT